MSWNCQYNTDYSENQARVTTHVAASLWWAQTNLMLYKSVQDLLSRGCPDQSMGVKGEGLSFKESTNAGSVRSSILRSDSNTCCYGWICIIVSILYNFCCLTNTCVRSTNMALANLVSGWKWMEGIFWSNIFCRADIDSFPKWWTRLLCSTSCHQ